MDENAVRSLFAQLDRIESTIDKIERRQARALKAAALPRVNEVVAESRSHKGKRKYGLNTWLTAVQVKALTTELGGRDKFHAVIEHFDGIKAAKGYIYANDYLPILKWGIRAYEEYRAEVAKAAASESGATKAANAEEERWRMGL